MKKKRLQLALLSACFSASISLAWGQNMEIIQTAKGTSDRLTSKGIVNFTTTGQPEESNLCVFIDYRHNFQEFIGIGGAFTDAAAETFYKLPVSKQQEILTAYFDKVKGIGYTFGRTHINSCDFSSYSYAYVNDPADTLLKTFSIEVDKKYRIPFIKLALERTNNELKLFASPWSPPAFMKTNNDMLHGGKLRPEYYRSWALYYVKFIEAYKKEGIPIWGITVQNEPMAVQRWESCIYTAEDELNFVKNYLGPQLKNSGLLPALKLMIWDHNRNLAFHRANTVLSDPQAAQYVWGTAFHWYVGDNYDNIKRIHEAFPDKGLVFSEGCAYPFSWENVKQWNFGEKYGEAIIHDLNNNTNAWTDWNLILDEKGGPNHVENYCLAPIIADTRTGEVHYMSSYYYIGHFSKYIRPGAKRISCSSMTDDILATAFINPDNSIVLVMMNQTDNDIDINVWMDGKTAPTKMLAHSIVTCLIQKP
ncbi:MAG TPA: glycoside hydrolase family 30 protein [Bacteroidales bacterium]|nr:glycoside hydrolase family 30 protein [Bacteroidales bacterium]HPO66368.1 glycoside hydrolase family 30 protein [Bacteroidales bacterium]